MHIGIPISLASCDLATTEPPLPDKTSTGLFSSEGLTSLSQETKKLLQSTNRILPNYPTEGFLFFEVLILAFLTLY